ncbi:MAG: GMC family oxidoreductase [Deltaproteobacteria bacterium]|nr:GMC family oxidoreductase [Deltaproteobacteria bacterium]
MTVLDVSALATPPDVDAAVCIVGSGSAGATAAWVLAEAGLDVVVLEEGGDFTGPQLTGRDGPMYDQLYMDRGARTTSDLSITVLQGRVLGGGPVINASDVVPMHDGTARHWVKRWGLTDFSPEALAPYRDRALRDLSVNAPAEEQLNTNNRLLREGTRALGWRGEVMAHNRVGCAGTGTCLIGCPLNAKRNTRFVAIPAALEKGARFLTRARAVRIEGADSDVKTVHVWQLDPRGHHERALFHVRARTVVLAANALASAQLLLRSGIGNAHVGRHVSLQPQLPVTALFKQEVRFFRGIPQAYAITQHERFDDQQHGWWGFRIEAIAGTPGIVSTLMPMGGAEGKALMRRYPHVAAVLCLLPDDATSRLEVESNGRLRIHHGMDAELLGRAREAGKAAARAFLAAGAVEVMIPAVPPVVIRKEADLARVDAMDFAPATVPFLSAHQQGGIRYAPSESDGAAAPDGRVYGTRGVYALDSAGYPSSASSHTMTPIMTTARMLAEQLVTLLGR